MLAQIRDMILKKTQGSWKAVTIILVTALIVAEFIRR